jgi:hypothetical protein
MADALGLAMRDPSMGARRLVEAAAPQAKTDAAAAAEAMEDKGKAMGKDDVVASCSGEQAIDQNTKHTHATMPQHKRKTTNTRPEFAVRRVPAPPCPRSGAFATPFAI